MMPGISGPGSQTWMHYRADVRDLAHHSPRSEQIEKRVYGQVGLAEDGAEDRGA